MNRQQYDQVWQNARLVRAFLDPLIAQYPEIFPNSIAPGYQLSGHLPESKKMPGIRLRQIRLKSGVYKWLCKINYTISTQ